MKIQNKLVILFFQMSIFTMEPFMKIINTEINIYKLINTQSKKIIQLITIKIVIINY